MGWPTCNLRGGGHPVLRLAAWQHGGELAGEVGEGWSRSQRFRQPVPSEDCSGSRAHGGGISGPSEAFETLRLSVAAGPPFSLHRRHRSNVPPGGRIREEVKGEFAAYLHRKVSRNDGV